MPIHYLADRATPEQIEEMLEALEVYIKFAVDIRRDVAAGGGELHSDCEDILLEQGSTQDDIWGANYVPEFDEIRCEALINISRRRHNNSMMIKNERTRQKVEKILRIIVGGRAE